MSEPILLACVVALCLVSGVPWLLAASLGVGIAAPAIGAMVVAGIVLAGRARRPPRSEEAVVLASLAAELRRGASLRTAIEPAATRATDLDLAAAVRLAEAGAPIERVAAAFASALPGVGPLAGPALEAAAASGGGAARVFARLADRAGAHEELIGERGALTAQARLSAAVVGGIPCVVLGAMALSGRLAALGGSSVLGGVAVAVGSLLMLTGVALVVVLTRRVLP